MKKFICIVMLFMLSIVCVGCKGNMNESNKELEKGKTALENGEYEQASELFRVAIEKDSKNKEAETLSSIVDDYLKAKNDYSSDNFKEAKKILDSINDIYNQYPIKNDINDLKRKVNEKVASSDNIKKTVTLNYNDKIIGLILTV